MQNEKPIAASKLHLLITIYFNCSSKASKRSTTSLSVVSVQATDIPPKETVTYTKQTQTASTGGVERDGGYPNLRNSFINLLFCFNHVNQSMEWPDYTYISYYPFYHLYG